MASQMNVETVNVTSQWLYVKVRKTFGSLFIYSYLCDGSIISQVFLLNKRERCFSFCISHVCEANFCIARST